MHTVSGGLFRHYGMRSLVGSWQAEGKSAERNGCWCALGTLGVGALRGLPHQLLSHVFRDLLLACPFLTCRSLMKAGLALNRGSSMSSSPIFQNLSLPPPSFCGVSKDATLISNLGFRNLGLTGWTKVFSAWEPLEILLGRGTVMETGARKWVGKCCTIHKDHGETRRRSELPSQPEEPPVWNPNSFPRTGKQKSHRRFLFLPPRLLFDNFDQAAQAYQMLTRESEASDSLHQRCGYHILSCEYLALSARRAGKTPG